ncbi:MAG: hypothetical protein AAF655_25765 [Bacteroidota bacterium]
MPVIILAAIIVRDVFTENWSLLDVTLITCTVDLSGSSFLVLPTRKKREAEINGRTT